MPSSIFKGLLAPIDRKNGWTIAEHVGAKEPKALQRFLNLARWDADVLRDLVCDYATEHLNDPRGVLVADPTRLSNFLCKQGDFVSFL